jgi:hypothetical protein
MLQIGADVMAQHLHFLSLSLSLTTHDFTNDVVFFFFIYIHLPTEQM